MGIFITAEGGDGSGKGTQMKMLHEHLIEEGYTTELDSYPRYKDPSAEHVIRFLNGKYGNPHPELASLPYAIDRLMGAQAIKAFLQLPNSVYLGDRYVSSNLGHNGSNFDTHEERSEYFEFERHFEHNILGIPKPDKNVIFMVPAWISQENIDKKQKRDYTDKKRDIHEADLTHLERTLESYKALAAQYPDEYELLDAMENSKKMRSMEDIQEEFRSIVHNLID
ncbi:MAG: Thymidylate kinase [Candidatus Saccharibacteria bacterium]|nr:Thymidylate kinase [Candidatus Saccharibacteria bacterium]